MAKAPSTSIVQALKFLASPDQCRRGAVCAVVGNDSFLRREVRASLQCTSSDANSEGTDSDEPTLLLCDGKTAELRDVLDRIRERSLFGSDQRVVVVEEADPFVKLYRAQLEDYVAKPVRDALLVLEVKTWPGNTRLAKAVAQSGTTIRCQVPTGGRELTEFTKQLKDWLIQLAKLRHGVKLERAAVDVLLDLMPTEVGILCQEIARLALLVEHDQSIDANLVRNNVGGWRTRTTWDMIDAVADGRAADALEQLDRLLIAGEHPHALLPQMASALRRFAAAARIYGQSERTGTKISLRTALQQSGVKPFKLKDAEPQLRQIGRQRAAQLYGWLLAADLDLKGHNSTDERARRVLETLIVRLSKTMSAPAAVGR
ncbi:MAG: DNA polymerase III subunit delta [Pirellulales bacterium]|nr:DNA polymerase III subunit delta [Pirellulales bacterium]